MIAYSTYLHFGFLCFMFMFHNQIKKNTAGKSATTKWSLEFSFQMIGWRQMRTLLFRQSGSKPGCVTATMGVFWMSWSFGFSQRPPAIMAG